MYYYKCPCGDLFEISQARTLLPAVNTHQRSAPAVCGRAATRRLPPRRRNLMRASSSPAKSQRGRRTGTVVVHLLVVLATSRRPSRRSLSARRSRSERRSLVPRAAAVRAPVAVVALARVVAPAAVPISVAVAAVALPPVSVHAEDVGERARRRSFVSSHYREVGPGRTSLCGGSPAPKRCEMECDETRRCETRV